jgi:hypothetical protein
MMRPNSSDGPCDADLEPVRHGEDGHHPVLDGVALQQLEPVEAAEDGQRIFICR